MIDTKDTDRLLTLNVRMLSYDGKITPEEIASVETNLHRPINEQLMGIDTKMRLTKKRK
jgi:hypothetical protein